MSVLKLDLAEAAEQLSEFCGFNAHYDFQGKSETYRITYRKLLPLDVAQAVDRVDYEIEKTCDKAEVMIAGRPVKSSQTPAYPLRRDGSLLELGQDEQRLIAMWGREKFDRFVAEGGSPGILSFVWRLQDEQFREWLQAGSKSAGSGGPLAGQR